MFCNLFFQRLKFNESFSLWCSFFLMPFKATNLTLVSGGKRVTFNFGHSSRLQNSYQCLFSKLQLINSQRRKAVWCHQSGHIEYLIQVDGRPQHGHVLALS
jgi:hypothetical protein